MKVVSLVPSITEALFDLGLTKNEVIGRTKFCIHPSEKVKNVPIIGGTKNINIEKIKATDCKLKVMKRIGFKAQATSYCIGVEVR